MRTFRICLFLLPSLLFCACQDEKTAAPEKTSMPSTSASPPPMKKMVKRNTGSYTGQVIEKSSLNKAGKPMANPDLFLRLSMGDYFIKFCESKIERSDLEGKIDDYITVKGTVKKGEWDKCPDDPTEKQSRTGEYFVINEWLK